MRRASLLAFAAAIGGLTTAVVLASVPAEVVGRGEDPDWPCIQRKVPALSVVAFWTGPPVDTALDEWQADQEIAELVRELAQRRVPIEEATAAVAAFAAELDPGERAGRLTLLFAGLFQTLDRERGEIIEGIERYARRQVAMAEEIRERQIALSDLGVTDPQAAAALNEDLLVEVRIFNERRQSLAFVCETPIIVEQRLFQLARAIQAELPEASP